MTRPGCSASSKVAVVSVVHEVRSWRWADTVLPFKDRRNAEPLPSIPTTEFPYRGSFDELTSGSDSAASASFSLSRYSLAVINRQFATRASLECQRVSCVIGQTDRAISCDVFLSSANGAIRIFFVTTPIFESEALHLALTTPPAFLRRSGFGYGISRFFSLWA